MTPYFADDWLTVYAGDCRAVLPTLAADSVDCIVTSPPYWGLRDYGTEGQLGLEATPELYVANLVAVFRELRRVLKPSGTCWLNLGDSYAAARSYQVTDTKWRDVGNTKGSEVPAGLKPKDLVGIPWRVAFALQQPYYTGSIRDERDRIWLAAMLDAEGCLFIHKRKAGQSNGQGYYRQNDNYGPGVEIANTSRAVVERVHQIVGKGSISTQEGGTFGRKQTLYRWNLRTTECRDFVREVYPYLVAKQQQARILIGCPPSGERAEAAHGALIALHRTGLSDVDFPPPGSMYEPGWYLRSDIVWAKSNPMPESVTDRPTKAHEYLFLLTKSARYYFDQEAVREADAPDSQARYARSPMSGNKMAAVRDLMGHPEGDKTHVAGRNLRSVWTIATRPYPGAHFAVFPPELPERCIKAGSPAGGLVLDPFAGSGTVGLVANRLSRRAILIDLNPEYVTQQMRRNAQTPLGLPA